MAKSEDFAQQLNEIIRGFDTIPDPDDALSGGLLFPSTEPNKPRVSDSVRPRFRHGMRFRKARALRDIPESQANNANMSDMNRDELKAHLENQDLKVDARLKEFTEVMRESMRGLDHRLDLIERDVASVKGIKGVVITTAIVSALAIAGVFAGMLSYGVASFDSGRDTSAAIQEMKQQSAETRELLDRIKAQIPAPTKAPAAVPDQNK